MARGRNHGPFVEKNLCSQSRFFGFSALGTGIGMGLCGFGAAFAAGICLAPRFAGTGYDPDGRMQGDFGSNVYFVREVQP